MSPPTLWFVMWRAVFPGGEVGLQPPSSPTILLKFRSIVGLDGGCGEVFQQDTTHTGKAFLGGGSPSEGVVCRRFLVASARVDSFDCVSSKQGSTVSGQEWRNCFGQKFRFKVSSISYGRSSTSYLRPWWYGVLLLNMSRRRGSAALFFLFQKVLEVVFVCVFGPKFVGMKSFPYIVAIVLCILSLHYPCSRAIWDGNEPVTELFGPNKNLAKE